MAWDVGKINNFKSKNLKGRDVYLFYWWNIILWNILLCCKLGQITQQGDQYWQYLANSRITCARTHGKSMAFTHLKLNLGNFKLNNSKNWIFQTNLSLWIPICKWNYYNYPNQAATPLLTPRLRVSPIFMGHQTGD